VPGTCVVGETVPGKVDRGEVRAHLEPEVAHLRGAVFDERVGPGPHAARAVLDVDGDGRAGIDPHVRRHFLRDVARRIHRPAVQREHEVVEERVFGGQGKPDSYRSRFAIRVGEPVSGFERHRVGRVPEESLAPMLQVEHGFRACLVERDRHTLHHRLRDLAPDDAAVRVLRVDGLGRHARPIDPGVRRHLPVRSSPQQLHFGFETAVEAPGARNQRRPEDGPPGGRPDQDDGNGEQSADGHDPSLEPVSESGLRAEC